MGQYEMIMSNLKAILEKQDQTNILLEKIFKFIENFKPLIDWVSVSYLPIFRNQVKWDNELISNHKALRF